MSHKLTEDQIKAIVVMHDQGESYRKIAKKVLGRASRKSTVGDLISRAISPAVTDHHTVLTHPKILVLDIETAPVMAHVWGLWNNNVGLNQINTDWYILSFVAKWAHSDEIIYFDQSQEENIEDDSGILAELWELLDEADFVVGHNIKKFDTKKINARFILNGFPRPSTYRQIDTLQIAKAHFNFTSNKLEYLTDKLCTKYKKSKHKKFHGHTLWAECLKRNPEAWAEMKEYNTLDVLSNQELYEIFLPWDLGLPNFDLYVDEPLDMSVWKENGFHYSNLGKYQRYLNTKTGQQKRGRTNLLSKDKRASILSNIV